MRSLAEYEEAMRWVRWGLNDCQISRLTGIPRHTVLDWRHGRRSRFFEEKDPGPCPLCSRRALETGWYAQLLGLYLGDGCISEDARSFKLRITLDIRYPNVIDECAAAIDSVRQGRKPAGFVHLPGCVEVYSYWSHWPCLFPQHAPGRKHLRRIELTPWQRSICERHPERLMRGLIQSDGCRDGNVVNGKSYPRYSFSNRSLDIQRIFTTTCEALNIHWTQPYWKTISIARRRDVAILDEVVGPKS